MLSKRLKDFLQKLYAFPKRAAFLSWYNTKNVKIVMNESFYLFQISHNPKFGYVLDYSSLFQFGHLFLGVPQKFSVYLFVVVAKWAARPFYFARGFGEV